MRHDSHQKEFLITKVRTEFQNGDSAPPVTDVTRSARIDLLFTMSDNTPAGDSVAGARILESHEQAAAAGPPCRPTGIADQTAIKPPLDRPSLDRPSGGARRDRTDDLLLAKQALSQLSYGPVRGRRTDDGAQTRQHRRGGAGQAAQMRHR